MTLVPYYDVGLATFNATDVVTFSGGASMAAAGVQPYDRIENRLGQSFTIAEIISDTSVRLTRAHTGTAQTNQPYAIWPTPEPVMQLGMARNALAFAGSPFISALAGLNGTGGDKGITVTGDGTMTTHTQTAFARSLQAAANAAAVYGTLGEVPNGQLPSRLSQSSGTIPDSDYNKALTAGFYAGAGGSAVNGPPGNAAYGPLLVLPRGTTTIVQIAGFFQASGDVRQIYIRGSTNSGAAWTAWDGLALTSGIGTAAARNTGTSGATVPLLNAANTWSADQRINGRLGINAAPTYTLDFLAAGGSQNIARIGQSGVSNGFTVVSDGTNLSFTFAITGASGSFSLPGLGTTAAAANVNMTGNALLRSTSSRVYKTDIEDLDSWRADEFIRLARPVWYRSLAPADRPDDGWYGLIAEEVAEIDRRLVHWNYQEDQYEDVEVEETVEETVEEEGEDGEIVTRTVERTVTRVERRLKEGAELRPDGVQYDRAAVMLLDYSRRLGATVESQQVEIAALQGALAAIEARVSALEGNSL